MTTSWNELQLLEAYSQRELPVEEQLLLDARLHLDEDLRDKYHWQQQTYRLVQQYGREQLRGQLRKIEEELFTKPAHAAFVKRILGYFR